MRLTPYEQKLSKQLRRGDKKKIAEKLGLRPVSVSCIISGKWKNDSVWEEVLNIVEERLKLEKRKNEIANKSTMETT